MKYLPDTNVLIYALAGKTPYANWLRKAIENNELVLSVITVAEFLSGANENEAIMFKCITNKFDVLSIDLRVAQKAAEYKKNYSKKTKKVWMSDCLIAATCKIFDITLITMDSKDYPMEDIEVVTKI